MQSAYSQLKEEGIKSRGLYQPEFFRLANADDKQKFEELIHSGLIFLYDELYDQIKELLKSRNAPIAARLTPDDYKNMIEQHLKGVSMDNYGVWVYYPWSKRVVHMLDEAEYVELRTSANKNKITTAERDILAKKKVGVIGLSVGQSVSVTMAMERSCGELRLADFDTLELNNLNRIRTGVHNLGLLKAYSVAREIAELDPFFKVICYTDGITDDNIDDFFLKGGKLHAVIDECDGVNIKILCRIKAKELHVPVLMEASDKGTLDVERYDLEPDRPIMHGWLQHLDINLEVLKTLKTNAEKLPYILPIAGLETLSPRMKASMIEMQVTLTTWPQLATAVTLGGAVTADTARRIFLNQYTGSGRFFIDMETLVPDTRAKNTFEPETTAEITEDEMKSTATKAMQKLSVADHQLTNEQVEELVDAATKAPSASNSQPWKWYYNDGYLFLFYSNTGVVSFGDADQKASYIACGAALENMELAAHKIGINAAIQLFPVTGDKNLVAAIAFNKDKTDHLYEPAELVKHIDARVTNRNAGTGKTIDTAILNTLTAAVRSVPGADLVIKTGQDELQQLANIIGPAERLKLLHPASHHEFYNNEMRWSEDASGLGIHISSLSISQPEEIALKMVKDPQAMRLLNEWSGGQALEFTSRKWVMSAAAYGLITMPDALAADQILGGRAAERMWLTATKNNIAIQPVMTPILQFARLQKDGGSGMSESMKQELEMLQQQFSKLFPNETRRNPVFLFLLNITDKPAVRSARKPLKDVFYA